MKIKNFETRTLFVALIAVTTISAPENACGSGCGQLGAEGSFQGYLLFQEPLINDPTDVAQPANPAHSEVTILTGGFIDWVARMMVTEPSARDLDRQGETHEQMAWRAIRHLNQENINRGRGALGLNRCGRRCDNPRGTSRWAEQYFDWSRGR